MGVKGYLLDAHTFLWAVSKSKRLNKGVIAIMENTRIVKYVSAITAYEIIAKHRLGKLDEYDYIAERFSDVLNSLAAKHLPVTIEHACLAGRLDWGHRDPFDRILAAQAVVDDLTLLTDDAAFDGLDWIKTYW